MTAIVRYIPMIGMIWGILAIIPALIGIIPCLGWIQWGVIMGFWFWGAIINITGIILTHKAGYPKMKNIIGLVLCILTIVIATIKLCLSCTLGLFVAMPCII